MKSKILVVEDDAHIRLGLEEILKAEGYIVESCGRGDEATERISKAKPQLVILDVMLPGKSGYEICKNLRARKVPIPILMLTAKGQELDKVVGLDAGADDYVTKPFGLRELLARVKALLRRSHGTAGAVETMESGDLASECFLMGEATIDPKRYELRRGDVLDKLTSREMKLLRFLFEHPDEVLSRDRLLNEVWGYEYYGTTRTLDQTVAQLRKKLGENADAPRHLLTVHGVGYRWIPHDQHQPQQA
jgi:DNA-binding response OmpR family regulator